MNPFAAIPPRVRTTLYLVYGLAGLVLGLCPILNIDSIAGVSVIRLGAALAYIGVAFGFTAAANVSSGEAGEPAEVDVDEEPHEVPDDPDPEPEADEPEEDDADLDPADRVDLAEDDHAGD